MNLIYREADQRDIPAMMRIRSAVTENVLSDPAKVTPQMYVDYLDLLGKGWVCEADGVIAGFAYADKLESSIWALFIDPPYEGRGIGKRLLALMVDYLFVLGHETITLSTTTGTRADAFYTARGWQRGAMQNSVEVEYVLHNRREHSDVYSA